MSAVRRTTFLLVLVGRLSVVSHVNFLINTKLNLHVQPECKPHSKPYQNLFPISKQLKMQVVVLLLGLKTLSGSLLVLVSLLALAVSLSMQTVYD